MKEGKQKRYLIASDFDGTLFSTFSSSPSGMDVKRAYSLALDDIFGQGRGEWFFAKFGLNGKTPSEVISLILNCRQSEKEEFVGSAKSFYEKNGGIFGYPIPECVDGKLVWEIDNPETSITQMLVGQKLEYLLGEIGTRNEDGRLWPPSCGDALLFLETVRDLKKEGFPIDFAIISSGHKTFIQKTLSVWNTLQPDVLVTEDDIRPRKYPQELDRRFKPNVFPLALTHYQWLKQQVLNGRDIISIGIDSKKRMVYIGDDPQKDMLMAQQGRVERFCYPQTSWQTISEMLLKNKDLLDGRPFSEVFMQKRDGKEADVLLPDNLEPRHMHPLGRFERR